MRVVIDTNVYISALLFGGLPGEVFDKALARSFETLISLDLLEELEEKLRLKFHVPADDLSLIREKIESFAALVVPRFEIKTIHEDPDDDRVLECAVEGRADAIVSGDRHLLKLGSFREIVILNSRRFLEMLGT